VEIFREMQSLRLFQGVPPERLHALAAQSVLRRHPAGALLVGETEAPRALYVVLAGQVKLYKSSAEGKEQTLNLLGPGDPFGMCTAFAVDAFPASAMAIEASTVLSIPGPAVEAVALQEPRLLLNINLLLSERLREAMRLIEALALQELPQRIAFYLLDALQRESGPGLNRLELAVTQRELAKILGATPEALSRALRKMDGAGILAVQGRSIRILNRAALNRLAEGGDGSDPL
jgi:CRP/FNR family transcriptional regulator